MDPGAWIALSALIFTAGQGTIEAMRYRRDSRRVDLDDQHRRDRERISQLENENLACAQDLAASYRWAQWAQQNLVLKPGADPAPMWTPNRFRADD